MKVPFSAEQLDFSPAEHLLFFSNCVSVQYGEKIVQDDKGLWVSLHLVQDPERLGWSLVELLARGKRDLLKPSWLMQAHRRNHRRQVWLYLNLEEKQWGGIYGEFNTKKVRQGLSLWGVLRHSRYEEYLRARSQQGGAC